MAYAGNNLTTIKEACKERKDDTPGYRFSCSHVQTNFERIPTLNIKSSYEVWIILRKTYFLVKKHFISVTHLEEVFFFICPSKNRPDRQILDFWLFSRSTPNLNARFNYENNNSFFLDLPRYIFALKKSLCCDINAKELDLLFQDCFQTLMSKSFGSTVCKYFA